jgi:predicted AlkP superfamily pyrophosphatase or phosphodiesterase
VINKNFLQEASLLQLSEEIFSTVINDRVKLNSIQNLLTEKVKEAETINFILADGLGYKNLISLETSLKENIKKIINTTFPSSTNVALTTFAMMRNPIDHGILGYYMYDRSKFGLINALNWNNENKSLLGNNHFKNQESIWKKLKSLNTHVSNFQPENLVGSALSNFLYEKSSTVPYKTLDNLIEMLSEASFLENRFNFIYYPNVDIAGHIFGVYSAEWELEIKKFEKAVERISQASNKKTTTIISADHVLCNIPLENRHNLSYKNSIQIYGDQRSVYINGTRSEVEKVFSNIPGDLISRSDLKHLLKEPGNSYIEAFYPDYCFLLEENHIIYPKHLQAELKGYHGGLTEEELKIPIIEIHNF